ncbi:MAG: ribonuclease III [Wenzhouxiangellaceae bacterium]
MKASLCQQLRYQFDDEQLLTTALTHRSVTRRNNERLEFLGDAILNCIVAELLYHKRPQAAEGDLSRLRARLVREETLADVARDLSLDEHLLLGEGELKSGGFRRASILADAFEAILGAVYLDGGFQAAHQVVAQLFAGRIEALPDAELLKDPKTRLQEWLQARKLALPQYELCGQSGPDHKRQFTVACLVPGQQQRFEAVGGSRRKAEQAAAGLALQFLQNES